MNLKRVFWSSITACVVLALLFNTALANAAPSQFNATYDWQNNNNDKE